MAIRLENFRVRRLEDELAQLNRQAAALVAEIERLAEAETKPEHGPSVLAAMAETQAARNRLAKLEARIADTQRRRDEAAAPAREALRGELVAGVETASRKFATAAWTAQRALSDLSGARQALSNAGFDQELRQFPAPPAINGNAILAPNLLAAFEAALSPAPRPPALKRLLPAPRPRQVQTNSWGTLSPSPRREPPKQRARVDEAAAPGLVRVAVLRAGSLEYQGRRLTAGDVVAVPEDVAQNWMRNGAADLVDRPKAVAASPTPKTENPPPPPVAREEELPA